MSSDSVEATNHAASNSGAGNGEAGQDQSGQDDNKMDTKMDIDVVESKETSSQGPTPPAAVQSKGEGADANVTTVAPKPPSMPSKDSEVKVTPKLEVVDNSASHPSMSADGSVAASSTNDDKTADSKGNDVSMRPDIVAAILGKSSAQNSTIPTNPPMRQNAPDDSQPKRKKYPKALRKVLSTRREEDFADQVTRGQIDLTLVLPERDCRFLGKEMWIFTLQQLEDILKSGSDAATDNNTAAAKLRIELLSIIVKKQFASEVAPPKSGENGGTPSETSPKDSDNGEGKQSVDDDAARLLLESWEKKIKSWREENGNAAKVSHFFLSGPLDCLIPQCTRNFLHTAKIKTVQQFLSLKRTETGLVVDMYQLWRTKCGLPNATNLTIAKHMIGLGTRIEIALQSPPSAPKSRREWFGGQMCILTGSAKDFLFTYVGLYDADEFADRLRTKDLADKLVEFRETKKLPPLKGTGKVAVISAWKTSVKEARDLEANPGRVLEDIDLLKAVEPDISVSLPPPVDKRPKVEKPAAPVPRPGSHVPKPKPEFGPNAIAALTSESFLETVFRGENIEFLHSHDIRTAQGLLDADKRPRSKLVTSIINSRKESDGGGSLEPASCVRLLYDWCARVRQKLAETDKVSNSVDDESVKSAPSVRSLPQGTVSAIVLTPGGRDPIEALSHTSKSFLMESLGISTAHTFLNTKTTTIANAFIKFRESRNMAPLKGLGAVASVSGWKAVVRKAVKEAEQGKGVQVTPARKNSGVRVPPKESPTPSVVQTKQIAPLAKPIVEETDRELLFGQPRKEFWVQGEDNAVFRFELTVRRSKLDNSKLSLFLTYHGHANFNPGVATESHPVNACSLPVTTPISQPPRSVSRTRVPFMSSTPGAGLVELTEFGVKPPPLRELLTCYLRPNFDFADDIDILKKKMKSFIHDEKDDTRRAIGTLPYNVFEHRTGGARRFFFFSSDPIENGQTVELFFIPWGASSTTLGEISGQELRSWIKAQLSDLSSGDLRGLLEYLSSDIGREIEQQIHNAYEISQGDSSSSKQLVAVAVARRRLHWLAARIQSELQRHETQVSNSLDVQSTLSLQQRWTKDIVARLSAHPEWAKTVLPQLVSECRLEMESEFTSTQFGAFLTSKEHWCSLANEIFEQCIDTMAKFSAELGSTRADYSVADDICAIVSQAITDFQSIASGMDLERLPTAVLSFGEGTLHTSNVLPTRVEVHNDVARPYLDAMHLCGEPPHENPSVKGTLEVLAVQRKGRRKVSRGKKVSNPVYLRRIEGVNKEQDILDVQWYVRRQVVAVAEAVVMSGVGLTAIEGVTIGAIREKIVSTASTTLGAKIVPLELRKRSLPRGKEDVDVPNAILVADIDVQPKSEPLFYKIVWPVLQRANWSLEAGTSEAEVTIIPPQKKNLQRTRLLKREAAQQRAVFAQKAASLGLGRIPKPAKKLFCACSEAGDYDSQERGVSVSKALQLFRTSFEQQIGEQITNTSSLRDTVEQIEALFESVAEHLLYDAERDNLNIAGGTRWCDVMGCEHLMRMLLVLPKMLNRSDLTDKQLDDVIGISGELVNYLVENQEILFASSYQQPPEDYSGKSPEFLEYIASRLNSKVADGTKKITTNGGAARGESANNAMLPSDASVLSDFVATVMGQVEFCWATSADMAKKGRRGFMTIGHPGLVCKHCLGKNGDGRYFFSSLASLNTASTTIDKHLLKCPQVSYEIKQKVQGSRGFHSEQQKSAPLGSQSAFFARLWDRLQSSRAFSHEYDANLYPSASNVDSLEVESNNAGALAETDKDISFQSHQEVLSYLQTVSPWNHKEEVIGALTQYYGCLEWGSSIYGTKAMPAKFSSEWILAKYKR
eukprot:Nitzschia sp. Nitz4//scaffold40_size135432//24310//29965//NITZ4_003232-RA/size135432-processed-gene-0.58-mRNA-1//-1//CDS//3329551183//2879//frame0